MKAEAFKQLVDKYLNGEATLEEEVLLTQYYHALQDKRMLWDDALMGEQEKTGKQIFQRVNDALAQRSLSSSRRSLSRSIFRRIAVAASVVIVAGVAYFFIQENKQGRRLSKYNEIADVAPGGTKATLTLPDGSVVALDDTVEEINLLATQGIAVSQSHRGELIYTVKESPPTADPATVQYHTITTPAGGRYQVNLPDGTQVWLNASSSLRYPVPFSADERLVELTGEGYFEVAQAARYETLDKRHKIPFIVQTGTQRVEVLGTHFNINAYADEPAVKTTLLEGSVRVSPRLAGSGNTEAQKTLVPGQQAVLNSHRFEVVQVSVENVIAWKNNTFVFEDEELHSIMRRLARWYDIEVNYQGDDTPLYFSGTVSASKDLSEVMRILELTGNIQYKLETSSDGQERRVIIMN